MKLTKLLNMLAIVGIFQFPDRARAEDSTAQVAREHFRKGAAHARAGEVESAAREFEEAYRLRPHYSVLYNLGQGYLVLGRPAQAVEALTRYLEQGGDRIDPNRSAEVQRIIAQQAVRVGTLRLSIKPAASSVEIDGALIASDWQRRGLAIDSGRHVIVVRAQGFETSAHIVSVKTQETATLDVQLQPLATPAVDASVPVLVRCTLADVAIHIDGVERGKIDHIQPMFVHPGKRRIRFVRQGYVAQELELQVFSGATIACNLKPDSVLGGANAGVLSVVPSERDARVLVDGVPFGGGRVPIGKHDVEVRRAGFHTWQRQVSVTTGSMTKLHAILEPQTEYALDHRRSAERQRTWAYALGTAGLVLSGAAVTLAIISGAEHDEYQRAEKNLANTPQSAPADDQLERRQAVLDQAVLVQRLDDWAFASAISGMALLATGVGLYITADPDKYGKPSASVSKDGIKLGWGKVW